MGVEKMGYLVWVGGRVDEGDVEGGIVLVKRVFGVVFDEVRNRRKTQRFRKTILVVLQGRQGGGGGGLKAVVVVEVEGGGGEV